MKKVSIIVPTYNEEESIDKFIEKIKNLKIKNYELIIVDDSTDSTAEVARKIMKNFNIKGFVSKRSKKLGKGSAIRDGLNIAKGEYILLTFYSLLGVS